MGKDADSSDTATISSTITSATAGGGVGGSGGAPAVGGRGSAAVAAPSAPGEELKSAVGVLTTLLAFSLLMVLAPTASFTASLQGYLDPVYKLTVGLPSSDAARVIYSGLLAIASVNVVVIAYVVKAFRESDYATVQADARTAEKALAGERKQQ